MQGCFGGVGVRWNGVVGDGRFLLGGHWGLCHGSPFSLGVGTIRWGF
jgi:hypothetical protein